MMNRNQGNRLRSKIVGLLYCLLCLTTVSIIPAGLAAENQEPPDRLNSRFLRHLITDAGSVLTSPLRWDKKDRVTAGLASAATLAFLPADAPIRRWVLNHHGQASDSSSRVFSAAGGPAVLLGVISAGYLYGELADKHGARLAFLRAGESLILSEMIVQLGKAGLGRARPYAEEGPFSFHPFSFRQKWQSFPSGHAASAWAVAASLTSHAASPYVDSLLYALATGVSLSRVVLDKHYASDVVAASLLGYFIGKKVSRPSKPGDNKVSMAILADRGSFSVTVCYQY